MEVTGLGQPVLPKPSKPQEANTKPFPKSPALCPGAKMTDVNGEHTTLNTIPYSVLWWHIEEGIVYLCLKAFGSLYNSTEATQALGNKASNST